MIVERDEFRFPLLLRSGNRYRVIVRGLKQQQQDETTTVDCFDVECRGSAEFRAGDGTNIFDLFRADFNLCLQELLVD